MLMVISPAKALDETPRNPELSFTNCDFLDEAQELIEVLRPLAPHDLGKLMKISDKLSQLNFDRNNVWEKPQADDGTSKQALMMFTGDVYQGLDAPSLDEAGLAYAQNHLRILSGLYGILRPLDLIRPYRLEMGTRLENPKGKNLYEFWKGLLTDKLIAELDKAGKPLINLASNEYFKSVDAKQIPGIITPVFKDYKNGEYKIISFYAKKARGLMVRYAIDNKLEQAEDLKLFDYEGYKFSPENSSEKEWVFLRNTES